MMRKAIKKAKEENDYIGKTKLILNEICGSEVGQLYTMTGTERGKKPFRETVIYQSIEGNGDIILSFTI